jgi:septal ring factor EnvC (AmiA/AmiB activator)
LISIGRRVAVLVGVALMLLLAGIPLRSEESGKNEDLQRIRGEIRRLKEKLESVRSRTRTAEEELEALEIELAIRSRELEVAVGMQRALEAQQRTIEAQITDLAPRIEQQKRFLSRRLRALYRLGGLSYLRLLMSIDGRRDPVEAISMLSYVVGRDGRAVTRFQQSRRQLDEEYASLADKQIHVARIRSVVEERRQGLAQTRDHKATLLASLVSEGTRSEQKLAELEEKARRLERLFGLLYQQSQTGVTTTDIREFRGALLWPLEGKVLEGFGRQRNAKFSTVTISNGIKIEAPAGAEVHAVFQGTVLFSQWFKGYGNLIILNHGNRVFSLYGNLKVPVVAVGDTVTAGQAIADVSEAEDAGTGYLYFEIREDNKPEDPRKWLR